MNRGTHQGRPSSSLIFDAVIMEWMRKNDLIDANFSESFTLSFRSAHDDMLIHGTPAEIVSFYNKLIIAFNKAGLEFNKSKTKILHNACMDECHWQVLDNSNPLVLSISKSLRKYFQIVESINSSISTFSSTILSPTFTFTLPDHNRFGIARSQ